MGCSATGGACAAGGMPAGVSMITVRAPGAGDTAHGAMPRCAVGPQSRCGDGLAGEARASAYAPSMIYELREYTAVPGRMPALVSRFKDHTLGIFARLGMEVVFMSVTELGADSSNELVYVMKFDSYDDMATKWAAFRADREWNEVRRASEADGPIVVAVGRRLLNPAAFSG